MNSLHHYNIYCAKIFYDILQRVILFTPSRLDFIKFLDKVLSHSRFMLTSTTSKANALKTACLINFLKTSLLNTAARHINATLTVGKRTQLLVILWRSDCNKRYIIILNYNNSIIIPTIYTFYHLHINPWKEYIQRILTMWTIREFSSSNI